MLTHCTNFFSRGGFGMMMPIGWLWLLLLVGGGLLLWRALTNKSQQNQLTETKSETAHEILLKEFAKGSITEEEYLQKKPYMD